MSVRNKRKPVTRPKPRSASPAKRQFQGGGNAAIVLRTPAIPEHRYNLNRDQVELIKRTIAKGASDDELQLFLLVAKRHRLDPFTRQLHLIRRWNKNLLNPDGTKGRHVATIQIGIDGYRQMASRYVDFGSISEAEYGTMIEAGKSKLQVPEWAKVRVYKKGLSEPSVGVAYWDEYAPYDLTDPQAFMWRKMSRHMLAKCAEALALRKAHPDLADIYTTEEMARTNLESTAEGRAIANFDQCLAEESRELTMLPESEDPAVKAYEERAAKERAAEDSPQRMGNSVADDRGADAGATQAGAPVEVLSTSLYWLYRKQTEDYEIMGSDQMKHANRELLAPLYSKTQKKILCSPEQLGKLISQLELRKVPIREWGAE